MILAIHKYFSAMLPFFVSGPLSKTLEHFRFLLSVLVGSAHVSRPTTHYSRIHRLNYLLHKPPHRSPKKGFFLTRVLTSRVRRRRVNTFSLFWGEPNRRLPQRRRRRARRWGMPSRRGGGSRVAIRRPRVGCIKSLVRVLRSSASVRMSALM